MTAATPAYDRPYDRPTSPPRTLRSDLEALQTQIASLVAERPIAVTAAAAGIGFVVGSRLGRPVMAILMGTASRAAANYLGEAIRRSALAYLENRNHPNTGERS